MAEKITTQNLINDLNHVATLLGHAPSYEDMRTHGKYGPATYQRRFGSWEGAKRAIGWQPIHESFEPTLINPADGAWLSGIIDGEGCFRIQRPSPSSGGGLSNSYAPVFCISFRTDDKPMLEELCRIIGIQGKFHVDENKYSSARANAKPAYKYFIRDLPTLKYHLIAALELYPLRSKKKFELPYFKLALDTLFEKRFTGRLTFGYTDKERDLLDKVYHILHDLKQFDADHKLLAQQYGLPVYEC